MKSRQRSLVWAIAWRFLRGRRSRLLDRTARAALASTAIGVMAMVIAMALMTGYREDLQQKLIQGNAAVLAYPLGFGELGVDAATLAAVKAVPGVVNVGRVIYGRGSLSSPSQPEGVEVTLRGVDAGGARLVQDAAFLRPDAQGLPGVVVGDELARRLQLRGGEVLRLVALGAHRGRPHFRYQSLRFRGTYRTGFAEFDQKQVIMDRQVLEGLLGLGNEIDLLEISVRDAARSRSVADAVEAILGSGYLVTDWQELNRELFTALRVQQMALFLVLGLIVLVSTFNVASTLVVLVRERTRDVGVLGAVGLPPLRLKVIFLLCGAMLGATGTLFGVAAGCTVAWLLTTFELVRFGPEVAAVYFVSSVPFRVQAMDLVAVAGFALGVTLLASWMPALRAARLDPSEALRYE